MKIFKRFMYKNIPGHNAAIISGEEDLKEIMRKCVQEEVGKLCTTGHDVLCLPLSINIYLYVCLFLSKYISFYLSLSFPLPLFLCLSIYFSLPLCLYLSISLFSFLSLSLSLCRSLFLSFFLSFFPSLSLSLSLCRYIEELRDTDLKTKSCPGRVGMTPFR